MKTALFYLLVVTVLWIGVSGQEVKDPTPKEATKTKDTCLKDAQDVIEALKIKEPNATADDVCQAYETAQKCYRDIKETNVTEGTIFSELRIFDKKNSGFNCYPLCGKATASCRDILTIESGTSNKDCLLVRQAFIDCLNKEGENCEQAVIASEMDVMETYLVEQEKPYCGQCGKADEVEACKTIKVDPDAGNCTKFNEARTCFADEAKCNSVAIEFVFMKDASVLNINQNCHGCTKPEISKTRHETVKDLIKTPTRDLAYCKNITEYLSTNCDATTVEKEIKDLEKFAEDLGGKLTCSSSASFTQVSLVAILTSMFWLTSRLF